MEKIKKNSIKLSLIVIFMILLLSVGIIAVINPTKYTSFVYRNGLIVFLIGIMNIIISSFFIYEFGSKLVSRKAIFTIDNKGINDKVNILNYPFIEWKDILKIEECNINNIPHLKVLINNPEQYINQKKGLKKWVLNYNFKKYETPVLLNKTYLSSSFDEFKKTVLDSYNEHK